MLSDHIRHFMKFYELRKALKLIILNMVHFFHKDLVTQEVL